MTLEPASRLTSTGCGKPDLDLEDGLPTGRRSSGHSTSGLSIRTGSLEKEVWSVPASAQLRRTSRATQTWATVLRFLNVSCSLREYWLLLASWVLSVPGETYCPRYLNLIAGSVFKGLFLIRRVIALETSLASVRISPRD